MGRLRQEAVRIRAVAESANHGADAARIAAEHGLDIHDVLRYLKDAEARNLLKTNGNEDAPRPRFLFPSGDEERLATLLRCVNGEIKSAALLVMDTKTPRNQAVIREDIGLYTRKTLPTRSVFGAYCHQNFVPAGVARIERVEFTSVLGDIREGNGFVLTDEAVHYAHGFAAATICLANTRQGSITPVVGRSASKTDSYAPYQRLRIIEQLRARPQAINEIAEQLGVEESVTRHHISHLELTGLLHTSTLHDRNGNPYILITEQSASLEQHLKQRRKKSYLMIAEWFLANERGRAKDVKDAVHLPGTQDEQATEVRATIDELVNQGYIRQRFPGSAHTKVTLDRTAESFLTYIDTLRAILRGTEPVTIPTTNEMRYAIERNLDFLRKNGLDPRKKSKQVATIVTRMYQENGLGARPRDIRHELRLPQTTIDKHLVKLVNSGEYTRTDDNHGQVWYRPTK